MDFLVSDLPCHSKLNSPEQESHLPASSAPGQREGWGTSEELWGYGLLLNKIIPKVLPSINVNTQKQVSTVKEFKAFTCGGKQAPVTW